MYGFNAISAYNGWSIAVVGISIVFSGLVFLSVMISNLHKLLSVWQNRSNLLEFFKDMQCFRQVPEASPEYADLSYDFKAASGQFRLLVDSIGQESFSLPKLLDMAEKRGVAKPHSTINDLLQHQIVIPDGNGFYGWNHEVYENLQKKG